MDFSGSEIYEDNEVFEDETNKGCLGWFLRIFLSLLALLLVVGALCAYFLTTDLARIWLLNRVNRSIRPARINLEKWEVPLVGSMHLHGVEYNDPTEGLQIDVREITLKKGVRALLPFGRLALGEIIVQSPVISYDNSQKTEQKKERTTAGTQSEDEKSTFFLPVADVGGKLFVRDGAVILRQDGREILGGTRIEGDLKLDSLWRPFNFNLRCLCGGGELSLTAEMRSVMSLSDTHQNTQGDKVTLHLKRMQLAELKEIFSLAGLPVMPVSGVAEGALTFERRNAESSFQLVGGMLVDDLQLAARKNEPSPAGNIALLIDAAVDAKHCDIRKFELNSPWGRTSINGRLREVPDNRRVAGNIDAELSLDIAAITRDFHALLQINDDLEFTDGKVQGKLKINESGAGVAVQSSLSIDDLVMLYQRRRVALEQTLSVELKARLSDRLFPEIDELRVQGSFVDLYGSGNLRQAAVKGYFDLTRLAADFKGIFNTDDDLSGAAHFNLITQSTDDETRFDLMTKLSKFKLSLPGSGRSSVRDGSFSCAGKIDGAADAGRLSDLILRDVRYDLRLDGTRFNGEIARFIAVQQNAALPVLRGFSLNAEIKSQALVNACGVLMSEKMFAEALDWQGRMVAVCVAESANDVATIRINSLASDIRFTAAGRKFNEAEVRAGGAITFNAFENSIALNEVLVDSEGLNMSVPEWSVRIDGDDGELSFSGSALANSDVALLYPLLADDGGHNQVRGKMELALEAVGDADATRIDFSAVLSDYYMLKDGKIVFFEKNAGLDALLHLTDSSSDLHFEKLKLTSSLIDIDTTGSIVDIRRTRYANLKGYIDLKFDAVEKLLRVRGVDEWHLRGGGRSPFTLRAPLHSGFLRQGEFDGEFPLKSLSGLGLSAGNSPISLKLADGCLKCVWNPPLNEGRLNLAPVFDFTDDGCSVSIKAGTLLDNVTITQEMVDKLLVHFNPLFHGSRVLNGTADVRINRFIFGALSGHGDLLVDAECNLDNLEMTLSPAMLDLLAMIQIKERVYRVEHLPLRVQVRDERVFLDAVTMEFDEMPLTFSGSVGFDSTVNYLVEIPVGAIIAAKTGLKVPEQLVVKVPVTGTVDNPRLDSAALRNAMGGVVKKTLESQAVKGVTDFLNQLKNELK
jgi:hypothetical protein